MANLPPLPKLPRWDGPLSHPFYSNVVKRVLDFTLALLMLIPASFVMIPLAIWVKLDSPGPVFYRAVRGGYKNQPFYIMKFRTMVVDADKTGGCTAKDDPRVTKSGKIMRRLKLDELPQLLNILKGEMSLVGPRPERAYFYDKFETYIPDFRQRMQVKPGLTGLAQVNGGYELRPEEKLEYDMEYIRTQSMLLDLKCILKTARLVFTHEGAR